MTAKLQKIALSSLALGAALAGLAAVAGPAEAKQAKLTKPRIAAVELVRSDAETPMRVRVQHAKRRGAKRAIVEIDGRRQRRLVCKRKACRKLVLSVPQKRAAACYRLRVFSWQGKARVKARTVRGAKVVVAKGRVCFKYPEQRKAAFDGKTGKTKPVPPRPEPPRPRWIERITLERPANDSFATVRVELNGPHADGVWFHYEQPVEGDDGPYMIYPWDWMNPAPECEGQRCESYSGLMAIPEVLLDAPCITLEAWAIRDADGIVTVRGDQLVVDEADIFGGQLCWDEDGFAEKVRG